jgi:hypothetical protein
VFGRFKKKSEIKWLIDKRFEELQQNKTIFCEYASMFAASAIELSKNNSSLSAVVYQDQSLRCLKFIEDIISSDNMVPINKTLGYDAVLYLKAFLCASASSKKNEV